METIFFSEFRLYGFVWYILEILNFEKELPEILWYQKKYV